MRIVAVLVMAAAVLGCVTVVPADSAAPTFEGPAATDRPTSPPEATLPPAPIPTPLPVTTPRPPTPTPEPDPNATPRPSVVDLMPLLSSEITVVNLAESPVELTVAIRDPGSESDSEYVVGTFSIAPLQVTSQAIVPARIRLEFKQGGGEIGSCTIDLEEGEQVQFAAIESGIAITTAGEEPEDPAELSVATASRCQAGEGT